MPLVSGAYWASTRHPWSCVLFVLPLLAIYEIGLQALGPDAVLRNGADVWLRCGLASVGISADYGPPVALVLILLAWTVLYREKRPDDPVSVWIGMTVESAVYAAALYGISHGLWPLMHQLNGVLEGGARAGLVLAAPAMGSSPSAPDPAMVNLVRYIGAGIYEEMLFRLLFFSVLVAVFNLAELPRRWGLGLAAVSSGLLFAGAHNFGQHSEAFQGSLFLFRTLAGLYFAWIYGARGFGVAVGAHAGYDVLVGLFANSSS